MENLQRMTVNTIRVLSAEAIDKANSGHPGLPLGCAGIGYSLFAEHMTHNPKNADFYNRDRFVLSAGHGSMLLYSLLHIFGYGMTMEDLKNFRQLGSPAAGHPEYGHAKGIETSTGPLGQGIANAVGMAVAETMMAARFNREGFPLVDHYTYVLCGDGCMMEGIEYEAASLAGHWKLGKLIAVYDRNKITIEGSTDMAFTEDVGKRHEAQGWQVIKVDSGEDLSALSRAVKRAKKETQKPSLIIVSTRIGEGSPKAGSAETHGAPLGAEAVAQMKRDMGWKLPPFTVPDEVTAHVQRLQKKFSGYERKWKRLVKSYKAEYPAEYETFIRYTKGDYAALTNEQSLWEKGAKPDATRNSSGVILNKLAKLAPNMVGGAADLAPSTKTYLKDMGDYSADDRLGRNLHFGIREHAMAAITNGIRLHGGLISYCATFFVFSDYMKNSIRMSALMGLPVVYVLTHDSIGVGEDGPTHQPVEQLSALRTIPGIKVFRPADLRETAAAYISALTGRQPTAVVCSRQNLVQLNNSGAEALKGGYIAYGGDEKPEVILMATGSEVGLALESAKALEKDGTAVRVVSMPCLELFDRQPKAYRDKILPPSVTKRVAIEAGSRGLWYKYTGLKGAVIGIDSFGTSGPADKLMVEFGFTPDNVVKTVKELA
ncbi:MAG: transketolase [Clostridiales bacterium]|jgi:transketolase|nr:transketolase [Clostridiales bacterium]